MRRRQKRLRAIGAVALAAPTLLGAQTPPQPDPVLHALFEEATERSRAMELAQVLADSLGPRLTGTPESESASDWVVETYRSWGIEARQEHYGTWMGWQRGVTSVGLTQPRLRTLEATLLAWSPGTDGPVVAPALTLPRVQGAADLERFLAEASGKFVLLTPPEPTCRPGESWQRWAGDGSIERMNAERTEAYQEWAEALRSVAPTPAGLIGMLEDAGARAILTSSWAEAWGVQILHDTWSRKIPTLDLSCEDYGLVYRLAANGQGPELRIDAQATFLGEVPVWNTLAMVRGSELPDEYVVLSAHFDTWDGASGATDNGTGTVAMMEAMRVLSVVYPEPRRTLLVGHWNGEEQGLNGSRAFVEDNPDVVEGLQLLLNQDEGTGRVVRISMQGLTRASEVFRDWFSRLPPALTEGIELIDPGAPAASGSDDASFICAGAPAFRLSSLSWDYGPYTWHTNRDTFDKVVGDDLVHNATLTAMLAYLASEEETPFPRERAPMPVDPATGQVPEWPACRQASRNVP